MEVLVLELLSLSLIGIIGALTPGPDILFTLRNTLSYGAKAGFLSVFGISLGWITFLSLIYFGLTHILNGNFIQGILSGIGSFYLSYLAYTLFFSTGKRINFQHTCKKVYPHSLILKGLLLNLSNPKAILFFTTIITPFMETHLEVSIAVLFVSIACAFIAVILVATFFRDFINERLFNAINQACGIIFIAFAILLLHTSYTQLAHLFL